MSSLAELPELVGFFSYSRKDDEHSAGALSRLRTRIHSELRLQLGRDFRLWQDTAAIPDGALWEDEIKRAIAESVFFIPIVTPSAVASEHCRFEFDSFLTRESALGRSDLVFPILYIRVPALEQEQQWRQDDVLKIIGSRQYADWQKYRHQDIASPDVAEKIDHFCTNIAEALRHQWLRPEDRRHKEEAERLRQTEAKRRAEEDQRRQNAALEAKEHTRFASAPASARQPAPALVQPSSSAFVPLSGERERALQPKDSFQECATCPEMVVVPAGSFTMGSPTTEEGRDDSEGPQHRVTLAKSFAVGRFAVTFEEWDACVADGGRSYGYYEVPPGDEGWGRGRRPVINVSWNDAKAYVAWLSRKTGKTYRLLSEAEWEYVARAGMAAPYWWGAAISKSQANYEASMTVPVDSFAPNPWGLYQVHGNVWEWTEDCSSVDYKAAPIDGSAWTDDSVFRVARGGSWNNDPRNLRSAYRFSFPTAGWVFNLGFRVGRTLTP